MGLHSEIISEMLSSSAKDENKYQISRSLRFNSADSAHLTRTVFADEAPFKYSRGR